MPKSTRRVVTGHDAHGKSIVLSDGPPPQNHPMHGLGVGADFHEIWNDCARGVLPHRCAFQRGTHCQTAETTGAHELGVGSCQALF
jgi:hypothetical protein